MFHRIILASGSPRRRELLTLIQIPFEVDVSHVEETVSETSPDRIVEALSRRKALDVAARRSGEIVLGADTIVWAEGQVLGKPADRQDAERTLQMLQGRSHEVYTGVTLVYPEAGEQAVRSFHTRTVVHVHEMSPEEIEGYLDTGDPFDKAGSYGIQGPFAAFIDGIEGDYHTVMGLPVARVYQELRQIQSGRT